MATAVKASGVEAASSSPGRRVRRVVLVVVAVLGLYLAATFLNPRVIPRARFLPAPASRGVWYDTCEGRPANRHEEQWVRGTFLWSSWETSTLGGCIAQLS